MNIKHMVYNLLLNIIPIIATIYIIVGIRLFRQKVKNKINYFSFLMFASAIYSLGYFFELNCKNVDTFLAVRNIEFLGSVFIPTFGILFISQITEFNISKKVKTSLFTVSTFLWLLFVTNPIHHLIYKRINLRVVEGFAIVDALRGPAFYSMMIYYTVFLIFSIIVVSKAYKRENQSNRKNGLLFLQTSFQIQWFAIIFIISDFDTYIDPVPITIMILAGLFAINEVRNNIFELQKIKWKNTYENIGEPAILIDKIENVVCSNVIANTLFYNQVKNIYDIVEKLNEAERNNRQICFETNSGIKWFNVKKSKFDIKKGFISYLLIDITEGKLAEEHLKQSEEKYRMIFENAPIGLLYFDNKGFITDCNNNFAKIIGTTREALLGLDMLKLHDENLVESLRETIKGKIIKYEGNYKSISSSKVTPVRILFSPITSDDKADKAGVGIVEDITERKLAEDTLKESERSKSVLSYHDHLTGLYNRRFYMEELARLDTENKLPLTIVMGDVNGLKLINDSFGHEMGDELLNKVAGVLKLGCRENDIIARLGGDEFVIILPKTNGFETEQIIKNINNLSLKEKVGSMDISISFGYETKNTEEEKIQEIFKKAEDHMYKKKLFESPSMRGKTISAIIKTLHEKNKREEQHSHRVSDLCKIMGEVLRLPEYKIQELKTIGLLHDIGKIAIDENILNKSGELTDAEFNEIKRHPEIGYRILNTVNDMSDMAKCILHHHERWDGKGYPKGLKGEDIPFVSRIIAIVDAYDAMTSERNYRNALPEKLVIEELEKNAGIQFDPELVRSFIEKVYPLGGFYL